MFHAFLSYSHRADAELSVLLQRAIERLGTSWWRRAPVRVFRDDATLVASAALWPGIEAGLKLSQFFVLLASPEAAASPWVERELKWWLANRPHERLLIVVTGGDISYDSGAVDFDWARSTCLPQTLRGVFKTEPLWVDLRFAATHRPLSMRHTRLREAALSLAAAVRGINKDQLESDDLRTHRRSVRVASGVAALVAVLVLSTTAAVFTARTQGENARINHLQAESRRLASEALGDLNRGGPGLEAAVFKAALAWRLAPTAEARASLVTINDRTSAVAHVLGRHTAGAYKVALSPDGQVLATAGREGSVLRWNTQSGESIGTALAGQGWPQTLRYSRDGSHLLLQSRRRGEESEQLELALFRLVDGVSLPLGTDWKSALEQSRGGKNIGVLCSAVHPDGSLLALAENDFILVLRVADGTLARHRLSAKVRVSALDFAGDGRLVFVANNVHGEGAHAGRVDQPSQGGSPIVLGPRHAQAGGDCRFANFSADGRRVALGTSAWQIDDRLGMKPLPLPAGAPRMVELTGHHAPELNASGRLLALGIGGTAYVWDLDKRALVFNARRQHDHHGPPLTLSADGRRLAGLQDGVPVVWTLDGSNAGQAFKEPDCGPREGLGDRCLARLCERLTSSPDRKRWQELLGPEHQGLLDVAQGLRCGGSGR